MRWQCVRRLTLSNAVPRRSWLGPQPVQRPWERDRFANVRDAADPRDGPLHAQSKSGMHKGAVLPQVEIPGVCLFRQLLRTNAREQLVVVVLALAAADDFAVSL